MTTGKLGLLGEIYDIELKRIQVSDVNELVSKTVGSRIVSCNKAKFFQRSICESRSILEHPVLVVDHVRIIEST